MVELIIVGGAVWWLAGLAGFIWWWTSSFALGRADVLLGVLLGLALGPLAWLVGWRVHRGLGPYPGSRRWKAVRWRS